MDDFSVGLIFPSMRLDSWISGMFPSVFKLVHVLTPVIVSPISHQSFRSLIEAKFYSMMHQTPTIFQQGHGP